VERIDGLELTMLKIPAGSFLMGSPEGEEGRSDDEGSPTSGGAGGVLDGPNANHPGPVERGGGLAALRWGKLG
jgi:hypothetical protein